MIIMIGMAVKVYWLIVFILWISYSLLFVCFSDDGISYSFKDLHVLQVFFPVYHFTLGYFAP